MIQTNKKNKHDGKQPPKKEPLLEYLQTACCYNLLTFLDEGSCLHGSQDCGNFLNVPRSLYCASLFYNIKGDFRLIRFMMNPPS